MMISALGETVLLNSICFMDKLYKLGGGVADREKTGPEKSFAFFSLLLLLLLLSTTLQACFNVFHLRLKANTLAYYLPIF